MTRTALIRSEVLSVCCRILKMTSQAIDIAALSATERALAGKAGQFHPILLQGFRRQSAQLARTMLHRGAWHGASIRRSFVLDRGWGACERRRGDRVAQPGWESPPGGRARENRKFIQAPSPEIWRKSIFGGEGGCWRGKWGGLFLGYLLGRNYRRRDRDHLVPPRRMDAAVCRAEVCYPLVRKHGRHRAVRGRGVHNVARWCGGLPGRCARAAAAAQQKKEKKKQCLAGS